MAETSSPTSVPSVSDPTIVSEPAPVTIEWPDQPEARSTGLLRARGVLTDVAEWLATQGATKIEIRASGFDYGERHLGLSWTGGPLPGECVRQLPHKGLQQQWAADRCPGTPDGDRSYRASWDIALSLPAAWGGLRKNEIDLQDRWRQLASHRLELTRHTTPLDESLAWLLAYRIGGPSQPKDTPADTVRRVEAFRWENTPDAWWRTEGLAHLTDAPLRYSRTLGGIGPVATRGNPPEAARPWMILRLTSAAMDGTFAAVVRRIDRERHAGTLPSVLYEVIAEHLRLQMEFLSDRAGESAWSGSVQWVEWMTACPELWPMWTPSMVRHGMLHPVRDVRLAAIAAHGIQTGVPPRNSSADPAPPAAALDSASSDPAPRVPSRRPRRATVVRPPRP